jgi:hypothetical protein
MITDLSRPLPELAAKPYSAVTGVQYRRRTVRRVATLAACVAVLAAGW